MVDRAARRAMCELLRHLAAGQITNDEFEERYDDGGYCMSADAAIIEAGFRSGWCLYSDMRSYRLAGRYRLTDVERQWLARVIVFLQTGLDYEWPRREWTLGEALANTFTFGRTSRRALERFARHGDYDVWPFIRRADFEDARRRPRYLAWTA